MAIEIELVLNPKVMSRLNDHTLGDSSIKFRLLDNPLVHRWFKQFEHRLKLNGSWFTELYLLKQQKSVCNKNVLKELEDKIKKIIHGINNIHNEKKENKNIKFPIDEDDIILNLEDTGKIEDSVGSSYSKTLCLDTRDLLNRLHRHFTYFGESNAGRYFKNHKVAGEFRSWTKTKWEEERSGYCDNSADEDDEFFVVPTNELETMRSLANQINQLVHNAELYFTSERWYDFPDIEQVYVNFGICNEVPIPGEFTQIPPYEECFIANKNEHDVWAPTGEILGKFYQIAYLDHDTPVPFDIWAGRTLSGAFVLGDRDWMEHPPFKKWLLEHGIESPEYGIPLGDITKGKELLEHVNWQHVKNIRIHNEY